jgi:hypothetical protein
MPTFQIWSNGLFVDKVSGAKEEHILNLISKIKSI